MHLLLVLALTPAVAVMPFRDLSGKSGAVGEAIRETVTSDLKEVPGLRVIERASIDQVIHEQKLQARMTDLDAIATVRVGTLVGASLIVAGAYQRSNANVRLTARFVQVETGEIVGTAKVDGPERELFSLEDQITGQLLESAGLKPRPRPKRPKLRSWKTIELYGDAVVEPDGPKKQELLQLALGEDPEFVYAARDLAELQQRMSGYAKVSSARLQKEEGELLQRASDARLPAAERARLAGQLFDALAAARRYHSLADVATRLSERKESRENAAWQLFRARDGLHSFDLALQAGEHYLKEFPTGLHFREVESRMHEIVETRRKRDARRAEYQSDLAEKRQGLRPNTPDWDYAPCIAARWNNQVNELMLASCTAFLEKHRNDPGSDAREHLTAARFFIILALAEEGDFAHARPLADKLIADSDDWDEELRKLIASWPTD